MRVQDQADVLSSQQEIELARVSEALERETTDQLVVVTLPSLNGRKMNDVSLEIGRSQGIGRKDIDNGVLLVVAPNERTVRIEVGYGLEGLLTDERAGRIIRQIVPSFREGKLAAGIEEGVKEIDAVLRADRRRPQYLNEQRKKAAA